MYNKCCVVNCGSRRKDVILHHFPRTEIGLQKWLQCINCDSLRRLSTVEVYKRFVCHKHFEQRFVTSKSRLYVGSYPSLFTDNEIITGVPEKVYVDIEKPICNIDHNYSKKRQHEDHSYCRKTKSGTLTDVVPSTSSSVIPPSLSSPEKDVYKIMTCSSESVEQTSDNPLSPTTSVVTQSTFNVTPKRSVRRRIIKKVESLTPNCRRLYSELRRSRRQLDFKCRARRAVKFSKSQTFEKLTKNMNPLTKKIMWMQIEQHAKKTKGRRFTEEEKLIGLSIMKQSPKCYKFLRKIFILPSKTTLNKMIGALNIESGINTQIFEAIKQEVGTWVENKKYCSIIFDEVSLEAGLTYNKHKDAITGLVEVGKKTNDLADHALVFMIRGALYKWQQPVAFYFCKGATSGMELKNIIKDITSAVSDSGLLPVAIVCDQGTAFRSAIKSLQEDTRREQIRVGGMIDDVIEIKGNSISVIYDPPHLLKGLRNNFLTKNIKYNGKISTWQDIIDIYKRDCNHAQMRLLPKLNDEHVIPEKIKKMKVKNCAQVFSKAVAATLSYTAEFSHYADGTAVSSTSKNTAEMVSFFDDLFDSVNGASLSSKSNKGKPLRKAVTAGGEHSRFWGVAIAKLKKITFINSKGKETTVPSLKNWVTTIESYKRLWQFFKNKNIKVMRPRYFNSDPIENFFGQARAYNFRNNDPNCHIFKCTFKSLLITRFINFHASSFNCEDDSGEQLLKLKKFFTKDVKNNNSNNEVSENILSPPDEIQNFSPESFQRAARQERLHVHSNAYVSGWVIRKILAKIKCQDCKANLTCEEGMDIHKWISFREYKKEKETKLTYPSEHAVRMFSYTTEETRKYLEHYPERDGILKNIKNIIKSTYFFDFLECESHKSSVVEYFLGFTIQLAVFNWCNTINKILRGTDVSRLPKTSLPPMQRKAYEKYRTKFKNKHLNK